MKKRKKATARAVKRKKNTRSSSTGRRTRRPSVANAEPLSLSESETTAFLNCEDGSKWTSSLANRMQLSRKPGTLVEQPLDGKRLTTDDYYNIGVYDGRKEAEEGGSKLYYEGMVVGIMAVHLLVSEMSWLEVFRTVRLWKKLRKQGTFNMKSSVEQQTESLESQKSGMNSPVNSYSGHASLNHLQ